MAKREMEKEMVRPVREYMDNGREQYELSSFYEKYTVAPQMKAYDSMYKFSRGDTECPSEMHGEIRNEQEGP